LKPSQNLTLNCWLSVVTWSKMFVCVCLSWEFMVDLVCTLQLLITTVDFYVKFIAASVLAPCERVKPWVTSSALFVKLRVGELLRPQFVIREYENLPVIYSWCVCMYVCMCVCVYLLYVPVCIFMFATLYTRLCLQKYTTKSIPLPSILRTL